MYQENVEVEVHLASREYTTFISVLVSFKVCADGVYSLKLDGLEEIYSDLGSSPLILTQYEIAQLRFSVADVIERKYVMGEYSNKSA